MSDHCLNCGNPVQANYCEQCGQKTSTHRFSLAHIFTHDFVHGIFHLDKGFFYTIRELIVRPGHSIREFIAGKRVKHFNYFTLILLILTIGLIFQELSPVNPTEIFDSVKNNKTVANFYEKAVKEYPKLFVLGMIPVYAVSSWIFFRKAKHNFAEHLVLNSYKGAGELIVSLISSIALVITYDYAILKIIYSIVSILVIFYSVRFYIQYFSVYGYPRAGLFFRSLLAALSLNLLIFIVTLTWAIISKS
jgi:hypothetical protein